MTMIFSSDRDEEREYEGSMFGPRPGTWWIRSESDSRWNSSGRARVGGFAKPQEVDEEVKRLKKTLGEPPQDLEWGYMKD
jgi:hypothetical protein